MILKCGNMWDSKAALICVTGNSFCRADGAVVMGRGAAKEALDRHPGINAKFGSAIRLIKRRLGSSIYGLVILKEYDPHLGLFQVKYNFRAQAELELIAYSCEQLTRACSEYPLVAVNFPGIGWGGLNRSTVLPVIQGLLPSNVEVWEYPRNYTVYPRRTTHDD